AMPSATAAAPGSLQLSAIYSYSFKKVSICLHAAQDSADAIGIGGSRCLQLSQPNRVTVELADGQRRTVELEGLRLEPITCSGLRRQSPAVPGCGVELSVSAVAEDDEDHIAAGVVDEFAAADKATIDRVAGLIREARGLLCSFCSASLADLSRVLEVSTAPVAASADGLHEAAAAYFCHVDHADERRLVAKASSAATPRPGECRYDGVDLTLPGTYIIAEAIQNVSSGSSGGLVVCARCRSPVGFSAAAAAAAAAATPRACAFFPGLVRLLRDIRDVDDDIVGEEATPLTCPEVVAEDGDDAHLRRLLLRLGEGETIRRASLVALSDTGSREVALLWRLDGRCRVYSSDVGQLRPDGDDDAEGQRDAIGKAVCRGRKACRLLYLPSSDSAFAGAHGQWSRDVSVGSVCLPEQLAMRALLLLAQSTGQLAPGFRRVHGFYCGFVPYG
ncbi:hypothetical protein BOX15_Mlig022131g1, partial [Macrostomum lignano]